jgi:hypothetical protein
MRRRAGVCALRCRRSSACEGMRHTHCALWAVRSCQFGVVGVACMVGLGSKRLGELVVEVDTRLVAR